MADRRAHRESVPARLVAFARSLVLLAVIAVGVPALLVYAARERFGGASPLHGVPPPSEWADRIGPALTDRLTNDTIADIVIRLSLIVAWVAVAVLLLTVIAEVVHMLRHDGLALPDVRGLGASQRAARVIASGLLVIVPMFTSPSGTVGGAGSLPAAPAATSDAANTTTVVHRSDSISALGDAAGRTARAPRPESGSAAGSTSARSTPAPDAPTGGYVVQVGDSVFGIAERFAGPEPSHVAAFAEQIVDANLGRRMPDGRHFTNAAFIDVGWVLELPTAADGGVSSGDADESPRAVSGAESGGDDGVHVVESGESLWSIADEELGDPQRWPEVYEANEGRTFADGRVLDDPDLIQPGWELELPTVDVADATGDVDDGRIEAAERTVVAPLPDVDGAVEPAASEVDERAAQHDALDPSGHPNADTVSPDGATAPARRDNVWDPPPPDPVSGVDAAGGNRADASAAGDAAADDRESGDSDAPALLGVAGAAMLSAGVLTLLGVRRRGQLRRARPRATLPPPAARPAATERALRSIGAGERFVRVEHALRGAARPLARHGRRVLVATVAADGSLELLATGGVELPAPWVGAGDTWRVAASTPLELLAAGADDVGVTCPTLVQLGTDANGDDVYVDLEAFGAIEIGGPGDQADAVVAAVAATLAGSVSAEVTTLVGLGVPDAAFLGHRLYTPVVDSQRAFEAAADAIGSTATMTASTFELRAEGSAGDTWEPAVVLVGSAAGTVPAPEARNGLAIVSAAPILGPSSRLAPDGDAWVLLPAGIRLRPVGLSTSEVEAIAELVTVGEPDHEAISPPTELDRSALTDDHTIVTPRDVRGDALDEDEAHGNVRGDDGVVSDGTTRVDEAAGVSMAGDDAAAADDGPLDRAGLDLALPEVSGDEAVEDGDVVEVSGRASGDGAVAAPSGDERAGADDGPADRAGLDVVASGVSGDETAEVGDVVEVFARAAGDDVVAAPSGDERAGADDGPADRAGAELVASEVSGSGAAAPSARERVSADDGPADRAGAELVASEVSGDGAAAPSAGERASADDGPDRAGLDVVASEVSGDDSVGDGDVVEVFGRAVGDGVVPAPGADERASTDGLAVGDEHFAVDRDGPTDRVGAEVPAAAVPGGGDEAEVEVDGSADVSGGVDVVGSAGPEAQVEASPAPPHELLVRLLGPVDVVDEAGEAVSFERSKTRELVAWLATHRDRSTRSAARTALWELDVRDATFANVVSEARRSLARLVEPPAGEEWVGRTMTDSLPLHPLVITDADVVRHALDVARLQPPAQAIGTLAPAVELIAGMPFAGTSYLWPDSEGITSNLVLLATSATTELAAHCLSTGDIEGVFRATGRGLQVLPGHEELIGLRMEAHARSGDHAGVRQEWESYERVINGDPWSDGEPAPKLVDLRRRLLDPTG